MYRYLIIRCAIIVAMFTSVRINAQIDTEFWLAVPEVTENHGSSGGAIKHIVVSTLGNPSTITVSMPANPAFIPIVVDIPAYTTERIDLFEFNDLIENIDPDVVVNKGIHVESTDIITAYLEVVETQNPDIFTLKGRHALGTEFYTPFQNKLDNQVFTYVARSAIDIVATEDNTVVTIVPTVPVSKADGTSYPAGSTITVTLNKGQTYSVRADSEAAAGHPAGTHITSTKPIAVTIKDDSVLAGGWDLIGDQIIPVDKLGSQYIVMEGYLVHPNAGTNREFAYVVVTEDNTQLFANNVSLGTFNKGAVVPVGIPTGSKSVVINSNNYQKFYCFHVSGYSNEIAGAILPPTDQCSGSSRVGFSYSYGETDQKLYINIMVQQTAKNGFLVDGQPASWLTPVSFVNIPGGIWAVAQFGPLNGTILAEGAHEITNTQGLFHMGYINATGPGALYGYFSDFAQQEISALFVKSGLSDAKQCEGEETQLRVDGGFTYSWTGKNTVTNASVTSYLNSTTIYNPIVSASIPSGKYQFSVVVGGACGEPPVTKNVSLEVVKGPDPQNVNVSLCEGALGTGCKVGYDLSVQNLAMTGGWPLTTVTKWEKDVYNEYLMYSDYELEKHLSVFGTDARLLKPDATNPLIDAYNPSSTVLQHSIRYTSGYTSLTPKAGYSFDLSTGDVFKFMIYNYVDQPWSQDKGPRNIKVKLKNATDSLELTINLTKIEKWEEVTADFSSFNSNAVFDILTISFIVPDHEQDIFYIDDIRKLVDHQVVKIQDPTNADFCQGSKLYATVENDFGCKILSTLNPTIGAATYSVNNLNLTICEDVPGSGIANNYNLNSLKNSIKPGANYTIDPATGWSYIAVNKEQIYEDYEGNSTTTTASVGTFSRGITNPEQLRINKSAIVGRYTNLTSWQTTYLSFTIPYGQAINLAEGNIFKIQLYDYCSSANASDRVAIPVTFELRGGTSPVVSRTGSIVNKDKWEELIFDFSSDASYKNYDEIRITFKVASNGSDYIYIDNFRRILTPHVEIIPFSSSSATIKNGDTFYALVKDNNDCIKQASVKFTVGAGNFAVNNLTNVLVCQDDLTPGKKANVDLNNYADALIGSTGVANGNFIYSWEKTYTNTEQIYDDFDNAGIISWNKYNFDNGSDVFNESTANPNINTTNSSSLVGAIAIKNTRIYTLSTDLIEPVNLSEGYIFKMLATYITNQTWANDATDIHRVKMALSKTGETIESAWVSIHTTNLNKVWTEMTFDFSAYNTNSGYDKITFTFESNEYGTSGYFIDDFKRVRTTFTDTYPTPDDATISNGDIFYAYVSDPNGCKVKASLSFKVDECGPPVTNQTVTYCEDTKGSGTHSNVNLTLLESAIMNGLPNTIAWYSNATRTTLVTGSLTNQTVSNGTIFYVKVTNPGTGKSSDAQVSFTVNSLPTITFPAISSICLNATAFTISGITPTGGTLTGNGISGTTFTPSAAGVGTHTITYSYTDANTCTNIAQQMVTVKPMPNASLISANPQSYCGTTGVTIEVTNITSATYNWTKDGNPYTGGNKLTAATKGTYAVNINLNGCTQSINGITVNALDLPTYSISGGGTICEGQTLPSVQVSLTGVAPWDITYNDGTSHTATVSSSPYTIPFTTTAAGTYTFILNSVKDAQCTGSTNTSSAQIKINVQPVVNFTAFSTVYCTNSASFDISSKATPAGGTFSGNGITGTTFNPSAAGIGTHTITYSYSSNGCSDSKTQTIEVNALPTVNIKSSKGTDICPNTITVLDGTPAGGSGTYTTHSWTGSITPLATPAQQISNFSTSTPNIYPLTYTVTDSKGCKASGTVSITVHSNPAVTFNNLPNQCTNNTTLDLSTFVSPTGGIFSGTGVTANLFDPKTAGANTHSLTYTYTDSYSCSTAVSKPIIVYQQPVVTIGSLDKICEYETPVTLTVITNPNGGTGTFTGNGVTGTQFSPAGLSGSQTITYSYSINGCSNTDTEDITVHTRPVLNFNLNSNACSDDSDIILSASPSGGTFSSLLPLNGSILDPSSATPEQVYEIKYTYTDAVTNCSNEISKNITIHFTPAPSVTNNFDVIQNVNSTTIPSLSATGTNLTWYNDPGLTSIAATGVTTFTPPAGLVVDGTSGIGKIGVYTFYVTQEINGCISEATPVYLELVNCPAPTPSVTNADACINGPATDKTLTAAATLQPGDEIRWYTINGSLLSTGTDFTPSETLAGTYNYQVVVYDAANTCEGPRTQAQLVIYTPPVITITAPNQICQEANPVSFDGNPTGGTFSGNGISGNSFNPQGLSGSQTITYSVNYGNGCSEIKTHTILVNPTPTITFNAIAPLCEYDTPVTITANVNPSGGVTTFSGNGVSNNLFDPSTAQIGANTISVQYKTTENCSNTTTGQIIVNARPDLTFQIPSHYCIDNGIINLSTFVSPQGGTFSGSSAINGNNFDPEISGSGDFTITYLYNDGNCENTIQTDIQIKALPELTFNLQSDICTDNETIQLSASADKAGSKEFSAQSGVSNDANLGWIFNPSVAPLNETTNYDITFTFTDTDGCINQVTRPISVHYTAPPTTTDNSGQTQNVTATTIPVLTATGTNIKWYGDNTALELLSSGNNFTAPSNTVIDANTNRGIEGVYTFYATQTLNSCKSATSVATLTLNNCPWPAPGINPQEICFGEQTPQLIVSPSDPNLEVHWVFEGNEDGTGNSKTPSQVQPGTYTWKVYQRDLVLGCNSASTSISFTIKSLPEVQIIDFPSTICSDATPISVNTLPTGGTISVDGSPVSLFDPSAFTPGIHNLEYSYTDSKNCTNQTSQNIEIFYTEPPVANNKTILLYEMVDYISASGNGTIIWYDRESQSSGQGETFNHGHTTAGEWYYDVSLLRNGCQSVPVEVKLTIIDCGTPAPIIQNPDLKICEYENNSTFLITGIDPLMKHIYVRDSIDKIVSDITTSPYQFTSSEINPGTYKYYVSQDTGCESSRVPIFFTIYKQPQVTLTLPEKLCIDDEPVTIQTEPQGGILTGNGISGNIFSPSTGQGTYSFNYIYTDAHGCSNNASGGLTVYFTNPPLVTDANALTIDPVPPLTASGNNIIWYSDPELTTTVATGNTYTYNQGGQEIDITFFATQTLNGCESSPAPGRLIITSCPTPAPDITPITVCEYENIPDLVANGTNIKWYKNKTDNTPIFEGSVFEHGNISPGNYVYYVSQTIGCEGPRISFNLKINKQPQSSISGPTQACIYSENSHLILTPPNGILLGDGTDGLNTFFPATGAGQYPLQYLYTDPSTGCSDTSEHTITVNETSDIQSNLKFLTYTYNLNKVISLDNTVGQDIKWYPNSNKTSLLEQGYSLTHNQTEEGTYSYYVTQTENNCESNPVEVVLRILSCGTPQPIASSPAPVCVYNTIPDLTATGLENAIIKWYDDINLKHKVHEGEIFSTGKNTAGKYTYYVTQDTACEGDFVKIELIINEAPEPVLSITKNSVCEGQSNPQFSVLDATTQTYWYNTIPLSDEEKNNNKIATGQTFIPDVTESGTYSYWAVHSKNGCFSSAISKTFTINQIPPQPIVANNNSCAGEQIRTFTIENYSSENIKWTNSTGNTVGILPAFTPDASKLLEDTDNTFFVSFTANGCSSTKTKVIYRLNSIPPIPTLEQDTRLFMCQREDIPELKAIGQNITWYTIDDSIIKENNNIIPDTSGINPEGYITMKLSQTVNGCESYRDTVQFLVSSVPSVSIKGNNIVCENTLEVIYHVQEIDDYFEWNISGDSKWYTRDNNTFVIYVDWMESGIDTVSVIRYNSQGCSSMNSTIVTIAQKPHADIEWSIPGAGYNVEFINTSTQSNIEENGETVEVTFNSKWNFGEEYDSYEQIWNEKDENIVREYPYGSHLISLKVTNDHNCVDDTTISVFVDIKTALYVPNALSPTNASPSVREFKPKGFNLEHYEIWIYDKWGNLIWYSDKLTDTQPAEGWDGIYQGEIMQAGSYFWKIEARFKNGKRWEGIEDDSGKKKNIGSVMLIR